MTKVLYPVSFYPITKGHMNIVSQACELFDEVIVAIMNNPTKKVPFFTLDERVKLIKKLYENKPNVKVIVGSGATVDVSENEGCQAIVRGLRGLSDYDYEVQLRQINKDFSKDKMNTIFFFADKDYQFISSTAVKEAFFLGKPICNYVDSLIENEMNNKR